MSETDDDTDGASTDPEITPADVLEAAAKAGVDPSMALSAADELGTPDEGMAAKADPVRPGDIEAAATEDNVTAGAGDEGTEDQREAERQAAAAMGPSSATPQPGDAAATGEVAAEGEGGGVRGELARFFRGLADALPGMGSEAAGTEGEATPSMTPSDGVDADAAGGGGEDLFEAPSWIEKGEEFENGGEPWVEYKTTGGTRYAERKAAYLDRIGPLADRKGEESER